MQAIDSTLEVFCGLFFFPTEKEKKKWKTDQGREKSISES